MGESGEGYGNQGSQNKILDTANKLNVPSILRDEPTVQEYLQAHVVLSEIRTGMSSALEELALPESVEDFMPSPNVVDRDGKLISLGVRKKTDITSGLSKLIGNNYRRTLLFLILAEKMAEEGLHSTTITQELLIDMLNPALDEFGLCLAQGRTDEGPIEGRIESLTAYGNRLREHQQRYEDLRKAEWKREVNEDPNLEKVIIAGDRRSARRVAGADFTSCPKVHKYADFITKLNELHLSGGQSSPIEQGSSDSTDRIRWDRIGDLLALARKSLEEGINGNEMNPYQVAVKLNYFLDIYSLHVEDKPLDKRLNEVRDIK